jgi:Tfp pilus assembly protein PilN
MKGSDEAVMIAKRLRANLPSAQPDVAIKVLGRSLPTGAWLKQINVDASRNISVVGISYSEDGIYEYIAKLKENVSLQAIGLVSSKPIRLPSGPAFEFELKASLTAETATSVTATNVAMRSQ